MAQSSTDICNSALQRVGAATITSIADNSREARACAVAYDSNRRDELRKYPWKFAIKRAVLAPSATAPAFDYKYAFPLPADCLRVLFPKDYSCDWVVEGGSVLTNSGDTLYVRYIADIEDVSKFDSNFYSVLAIALAMDVVEVLTNSNQKKQLLAQDYDNAIKAARRTDSFEGPVKESVEDPWWVARF